MDSDAHTLTPGLDNQVGAHLSGLAGRARPRLDAPGLRVLTVAGCPDLVALDLRGCAALGWIAIAGCPRLACVALPEAGAGTDLHVDFGPARPRLDVTGLVSGFDCCWEGGTADAPRGRFRNTPRRNAWIGPPGEVVPPGREMLLLLGPGFGLPTPLPDSTRELVLADCLMLDRLDLPAGVQCAELRDLPVLASVRTAGPATLRLERCPSLARVDGHGEALTAVSCDGPGALHVTGPWQAMTVHGQRPRPVVAPLVDDLAAGSVAHGPRVEAMAVELTREAATGNEAARTTLLAWCAQVRTPHGALGALQALRALAEAGGDPAELWRLRCGLRGRLGGHAAAGWNWHLPGDLAQRGWDADLLLWLAARPLPPEALGQGRPVVWSPRHLATLAGVLAEKAAPAETALVRDLLEEALAARVYRRRVPETTKGKLPPEDAGHLRRVVRALAALRDRPFCPRLVEGFCRWIRDQVGGPAGDDLLGALHMLGAVAATEALLAMAADARLPPERRRAAAAIALAPVRAPLLSFQEPVHA